MSSLSLQREGCCGGGHPRTHLADVELTERWAEGGKKEAWADWVGLHANRDGSGGGGWGLRNGSAVGWSALALASL